jgi:hypothetical protein
MPSGVLRHVQRGLARRRCDVRQPGRRVERRPAVEARRAADDGSLTASRGSAWIRFGTPVAPFALGGDGSIWNPIRPSYYDGANVTFGWMIVRFV